MSSHECFYCGVRLERRGSKAWGGKYFHRPVSHPHARTIDHIVPQARLRSGDYPVSDDHWMQLNRVPCCFGCNNRKGGMWPLDWLVVMPETGVKRFIERLLHLGCEQAEIDQYMADREGDPEGGDGGALQHRHDAASAGSP